MYLLVPGLYLFFFFLLKEMDAEVGPIYDRAV